MKPCPPNRALSGLRGFTLLEMLVTLALMAMISALLWQALQQVLRVERLLQRSGVDGQLQVVRREWLRGVLEASLVERTGAPRQLQGDGLQFTVASSEALNLPGLATGQLLLRIDTDVRTGNQRLLVSPAPSADGFGRLATDAAPIEMLSWQGPPAVIRYLDARGEWLDQWPPPPAMLLAGVDAEDEGMRAAKAAVPRLPRAIWLGFGAEAGGPLVAALSVTESGRLRRAQWEQQ